LLDALRAGQAEAIDDDIVLHPFTHIERKDREGVLLLNCAEKVP
jgi:hypothetical protein